MGNNRRQAHQWRPDIERSIAEYNAWYLGHAPALWDEARELAVECAEEAMDVTNAFRSLTPAAIRGCPRLVNVARIAVAPPWARDRLASFAKLGRPFINVLEIHNRMPVTATDEQLAQIVSVVSAALDPGLFVWLGEDRDPSDDELNRALLVLGERLTRNFYDPVLKNSLEKRQKAHLHAWLKTHGFRESSAPAFELRPGEFGMGKVVKGEREDGLPQNLPTDCVIRPKEATLALACVELKSAGDVTNVNKRRKEESDKHAALKRAHGDRAVMLLQLFGHFDEKYLGFEAAAGLDWAWDHRLGDFSPYLGI